MALKIHASDGLDRITNDLRSRNEAVRERAAESLKEQMALAARELSGENYNKLIQEVNSRLFKLLNVSESVDKLDKLIDLDDNESTSQYSRYWNYLKDLLPNPDVAVMVAATKTLAGKLAKTSPTTITNAGEFDVNRALEWLSGDRTESKRHAAVLLLRELAIAAPTLIYAHISQILDSIWIALRDTKLQIRVAAADCLGQCLDIIYKREHTMKLDWYKKILEEASKGLKLNSTDCIHGSLLTYQVLLDHTGMYMRERYDDVVGVILNYRDHRDGLIRRAVINIIPNLATYDPNKFKQNYLQTCMLYLLAQLRREKERGPAFQAIGSVAIAVGSSISDYLPEVFRHIRENLHLIVRNRNKKDSLKDVEAPVFQCIGMLSIAVDQTLTKQLHWLLDLMFACGLSEALVEALLKLAEHIQPMLNTIQRELRLLNLLSVILCGQPYRPIGAPTSNRALPPSASMNTIVTEQKDNDTIILALKTLARVDFSAHLLSEFVAECVAPYLRDDSPEVRKVAAVTCCQVLTRDPITNQASNHALKTMGEVLEALLVVGIADPDPLIRQAVLGSLGPRFDKHLAQVHNVRSLFMALNDEVFAIRELAIIVIGRLAASNPAYVMPSLRKTLIELLTELEYSNSNRNIEESARLLSLLLSASDSLIRPYVEPIFKALESKVKDPSPGVASAVLAAIGELARVGGRDLFPYIHRVMPAIINILQDQSSSAKRDAALKTLGQLAGHTGYVIEPYTHYSILLNILMTTLRTEQSLAIRRETLKVLGILGALDPYKQKLRLSGNPNEGMVDSKYLSNDVTLLMTGLSPTSEEFAPQVVIFSLMKILKDPTLSTLHDNVIQAIIHIFQSQGLKVVQFLPSIIPGFLNVIRTSPNMLEYYFQQLGILVSCVKQHIRNYLPEIFDLAIVFWGRSHGTVQTNIITLLENIAVALDGEFKMHVPRFLPLFLQVLERDNYTTGLKVLQAFLVFGNNVEEYMHLIIPAIVRAFEKPENPVNFRVQCIATIGALCKQVNLSDQASRIIHPLARIIATPSTELRNCAMDTLCALAFQLGNDYAIFVPMVQKMTTRYRVQHKNYDTLVSKLLKGEPLPQELGKGIDGIRGFEMQSADPQPAQKLGVNNRSLKRAWDASQRSTTEDWLKWIRGLNNELLKESPSHALRACTMLAANYPPLARELFNTAFATCYADLYDQNQEELAANLEMALVAPDAPPEVIQIVLNLCEFMEHDDQPLTIDLRTLGLYATKSHAFAKALHYKEVEFLKDEKDRKEHSLAIIEALLAINTQLQQSEAALGILTVAQKNHEIELKETWYEKLHRYQEALVAYERKQIESPNDSRIMLGRMRCLHALGEWEQLSQISQEKWTTATVDVRQHMAPLAAAAAWAKSDWQQMDDYIAVMKSDSPDRAFFRAILSMHKANYAQATEWINKTRDLLDRELSTLVGESYNRSYNTIVRVQMLSELEEMIDYKQWTDQPEKQAALKETWMRRLNGCQRNVDVWQRILRVRSMVLSPKEDMGMWIKFANLCRKSRRFQLADSTLESLMTVDPETGLPSNAPPQVMYAHLKLQWARSEGRGDPQTLHALRAFTARMTEDLGINIEEVKMRPIEPSHHPPDVVEYVKLLARCYLRMGEWQTSLQRKYSEETIPYILQSYLLATRFDKNWYKAWHAWALANFDIVNHYYPSGERAPPSAQLLSRHVVPAIDGFFKSIALSEVTASLQDTLRLLTLWFKFGQHPNVKHALGEGFGTISIDVWLQVIPQLIARLTSPHENIRNLVHQILADVAKAHPQAAIYPMSVAAKSSIQRRKTAAQAQLDRMRSHSPVLVEQAELVSQELIRVAILWHEMWHEGLEEASRQYFGQRNLDEMLNVIKPLHVATERPPETMREVAFNQAYGGYLQEAKERLEQFEATCDSNCLNQAWEQYYYVFHKIAKQLPTMTSLELQYVSPKLLDARDLELALPGSYRPNEPFVRIGHFLPTLTVFTSKQRPRKLTIVGSDGQDNTFLLKGHEDLRQDERVMQTFALINTLLKADPETVNKQLFIDSYPITPLSHTSGLAAFLKNSDTLHTLIRDHREQRKILLNIEHRLMLQMAPDWDHLTLMQKVEVFQNALDNTTGQDLYRILWLKSQNSEAWLERRSNYTRSLALMSMVGYMMGLGDRHPSNIMLSRDSGKVIHIDFGDCFEIAMQREKYPEKVPFRLTRMLIYAMEVSGIEGHFRITCENVMRVLRTNKDSLMAILEAFVYDPLLGWHTGKRTGLEIREEKHPKLPEADLNLANPDDEEVVNAKALSVIGRVQDKLTGRDFKKDVSLEVPEQVDKLIDQATSVENLVQCFIGWCAFW
ncbi:hypothetical protein BZG36_04099 [Bifiguratus adelaidae]|uniref:Serine/threonine-protein kinase TOR n=1 Tax=Bifiguratus adelaidae TaxID=1938954 RepID=A0A261XVW2_9FUNG|nr:hypothetical protein BZG36_04099 [Bifiguratus adelaidae]